MRLTPKIFTLFLLLELLSLSRAFSQDPVDVLHYGIWMDTLNVPGRTIWGHTQIRFEPKVTNLTVIPLDLLMLQVDSVTVDGATATWNYNDTLLEANAPQSLNPGDTATVEVWYHGSPKTDPSGFGGFYMNGAYAYNIGVGFSANPHTFGRVWFPCRDNFTDKALFDFHIRAENGKVPVCNGTLTSVTPHGNGSSTWHWNLRDPINTYLASVAVSDYTVIRDSAVSTGGGIIPISLYLRRPDSSLGNVAFAKLKQGITAFENLFGPYSWERVGYVMLPFQGGAMEHATSIGYPVSVLLQGISWEHLWAHELSHSWFGNLVTCSEAGEMWLNEGFAAYCEALFMEAVYDTITFKNYNRSRHNDVLRRTHIDDGDYLAVSGVDHDHTYGSTVYDKGASVAHALRGYMGDSAFFQGIRQYLSQFAFGNANSGDLRQALEMSSGQNLADFFASWVYQPGFPHFSVDSFIVTPSGPNYSITVYSRQRWKGPAHLTTGTPIEVSFIDGAWNKHNRWIQFSGELDTSLFTLPFQPVAVLLDPEERLSDATIDNYIVVKMPGSVTFPTTYFSLNALSVPDSAFVRITHNWIAPDTFLNPAPGSMLSNSRYWKVEGWMPAGFHASATFTYNGGVGSTALLDHTWLTNSEDSIMLFYRPGPGYEWTEAQGYNVVTGNLVDKRGTIVLDTLQNGEYALGQHISLVNIPEINPNSGNPGFRMFPNPAQKQLTLEFSVEGAYTITLNDLVSRSLGTWRLPEGERSLSLQLPQLENGIYLLKVTNSRGESSTQKLMIRE